METSASLIYDSSGNQVGFRGIVRDITERRQAEEERRNLEERLQRAKKMEALGTLAGSVAHDLNNVPGIIIGYSELLLYEIEASSPLRPRLVNILGGREKAAPIVQDLLTLARRGVSGRQVLNPTREEISTEALIVPLSEYLEKGEAILVVDDVEGQRDLATTMLRKMNYNVTSVSSGEEAVVYLKEHTVDLIVLDMIMDPGMDGLDTYQRILEILPRQKAIIVSGFSETERVNAAQALGAGPYLKKPYVIKKLGPAVRKELDRDQ